MDIVNEFLRDVKCKIGIHKPTCDISVQPDKGVVCRITCKRCYAVLNSVLNPLGTPRSWVKFADKCTGECNEKALEEVPSWWHESVYACSNVIRMPSQVAECIDGKKAHHPELGECIVHQHPVLKDAVTFTPKSEINEEEK